MWREPPGPQCRQSTGERATGTPCALWTRTGQVGVAGDHDEVGIEGGHGGGEVNGVVAAEVGGLGARSPALRATWAVISTWSISVMIVSSSATATSCWRLVIRPICSPLASVARASG